MENAFALLPMPDLSKENISLLCKDVLNLDDSILAVVSCNSEGEIRSTELRKDKRPWKGRTFDSNELSNLTKMLGPRVSIVIGVADQNASLLGPLECITIVYGSYQVLLVDVPESKMNLAIMLPRSCNFDYISLKLRDLLGR